MYIKLCFATMVSHFRCTLLMNACTLHIAPWWVLAWTPKSQYGVGWVVWGYKLHCLWLMRHLLANFMFHNMRFTCVL